MLGSEAGGWEAPCHEKLTLALLLLERRAEAFGAKKCPSYGLRTSFCTVTQLMQ